MSYDLPVGGNSVLLRNSGTVGRIFMAWVKYLEYVNIADCWAYLSGFGDDYGSGNGGGTAGGTQQQIIAFSQNNANGIIATGSDVSWVFICVVETDSTGLTVYHRHEGDASLNTFTVSDTVDLGAGAFQIGLQLSGGVQNHKRITAYKEWTDTGDLTPAQILTESTQNPPAVTANNINWLECDAGHTVGHDQSAAAQDWAVSGTTITINADEPNMAIGSPPVPVPVPVLELPIMVTGCNF